VVRVVVETSKSRQRIIDVDFNSECTLGDLSRELGVTEPLWLDGFMLDEQALLDDCGLRDGSILTETPARVDDAVVLAHRVGGPESMGTFRVGPGCYRLSVGIEPVASDVANVVVAADGEVTVRGADDVIVDGWVPSDSTVVTGHVVRVGDTVWRFTPLPRSAPRRHAGLSGRVVHVRAVRHRANRVVGDPVLSTPPVEPTNTSQWSWVAVLVPIPIAAVMAVLFSPQFALFAALSPVMLVARFLEQRRRHRKAQSRYQAELESYGADLVAGLAAARADELNMRRDQFVHYGETRARAAALATTLWAVRSHDDDFLHIPIGHGPGQWTPIDRSKPGGEMFDDIIDAGTRLDDVPVVADLFVDQAIAVVGDPQQAMAVVRAMVVDVDPVSWTLDYAETV
jgi:DNA segregation ATPase FtsK/SpoIIIE, S-DNA-T family